MREYKQLSPTLSIASMSKDVKMKMIWYYINSHDEEFRLSPLHLPIRVRHRSTMSITVCPSVRLEVIFSKLHLTSLKINKTPEEGSYMTSKTWRMSNCGIFKLQTLSLNTFTTFRTHRVIKFMIISFAVRSILENIKSCGFEWFLTRCTTETSFMISSGEFTVLRRERPSSNGFVTCPTNRHR